MVPSHCPEESCKILAGIKRTESPGIKRAFWRHTFKVPQTMTPSLRVDNLVFGLHLEYSIQVC